MPYNIYYLEAISTLDVALRAPQLHTTATYTYLRKNDVNPGTHNIYHTRVYIAQLANAPVPEPNYSYNMLYTNIIYSSDRKLYSATFDNEYMNYRKTSKNTIN